MKWLSSAKAISVVAIATCLQTAGAGFTLVSDGPGLTPEEFQEYLTLNTTEGWEPMSRVPHYVVTEGSGTLDLGNYSKGMVEFGGGNQFNAYTEYGCNNGFMFAVKNFGCGACVSGPVAFKAGWLWRQKVGGVYPTTDWYNAFGCVAAKVHHQGINGGDSSSCDNADYYKVTTAAAVMVYQGC